MGLAMEGRSSLKDLCCEIQVIDWDCDGGKVIIEGFVLRDAGVTDGAGDGGKVIIEGFVL